jgi:SH3-like domain-containing protein
MCLKNKVVFSFLLFSIAVTTKVSADNGGVFRVVNVGKTGVLNLRVAPSSNAKVLLELPRNARWIVKRKSNTAHGRGRVRGWQKIHWNNHEGWVDGSYLALDPEATKVKLLRMSCLQSNPKIPACCGYPEQKFTGKLYPIKVHSVQKVDTGQSLNMRQQAGRNAEVVATIPHDAVGIVKFPQQGVKDGSSIWEKVRWNGQNGWVNSYYLNFDPELSKSRERMREVCG